ncbi:hypothetical protein SDC9_210087 [bioreactor metagenome]|uniref:Uncharacterized protein n=1 Tax=bioreactor metagenome TaxID=1076179 RepID=A0A645JGU8_9ZZZZ
MAGCDFNFGCLTLCTAKRLVDHDFSIRQRKAFAFLAGSQQEAAHRSRHTHSDCLNVRLDEVHCIVDGQSGRHATAWRVDVDINIFF